MALALAAEGAAVVVTGRSSGAGAGTYAATVEQVVSGGGRAVGIKCDVRDEQNVDRLVATAINEFGQVDILVNNAGVYGPATPSWKLPVSWWDEVIDTNLRGTFLCSRAAIPHMLRDGGSIINVTSMAAEHDFPVGVIDLAYATSKQAVNRLTRHLAAELHPFNIAVNALSPVQIKTEGVIERWGDDFDFTDYSDPEAIGPVTTFLAKCRAEYTGQIIRRDHFVDADHRPDTSPASPSQFPMPAAQPTSEA
jgi:3-oxoacyl-[acyl-carrier protein] reductase